MLPDGLNNGNSHYPHIDHFMDLTRRVIMSVQLTKLNLGRAFSAQRYNGYLSKGDNQI